MKRWIKLLPLLFVTGLFAQTTVTLLVFQRIDLRFETFALLILIPVCQAAILAWTGRGRNSAAWSDAARALRRKQPLPGILVLLDSAILVPSWLLGGTLTAGWNQAMRFLTYYTGIKAIFACLLLARISFRGSGSRKEAGWILLLGGGLAGFGFDCLWEWLEPLSGLLLPNWQLLFRWLVFYGVTFAAALFVLFKVQTIWSQSDKGAALTIDCAVGFASLAAVIVVVGFFNRPYLITPWSTLVKTCGVLFTSALLLGCLQLVDRSSGPSHAARRRR